MIDYLLCFQNKETAIQFGLATGFTTESDGVFISATATANYALLVIGEHFVPTGETDSEGAPVLTGDGKWWVLVRDLRGIELPSGASDFIVWHSAMTNERGDPLLRPTFAPSVVWM